MTVGELKILLEGVDDDTEVLIPASPLDGFGALFYSPSVEESGWQYTSDEEISEEDLADYPFGVPQFLLVPVGYFEIDSDEENEFIPELN